MRRKVRSNAIPIQKVQTKQKTMYATLGQRMSDEEREQRSLDCLKLLMQLAKEQAEKRSLMKELFDLQKRFNIPTVGMISQDQIFNEFQEQMEKLQKSHDELFKVHAEELEKAKTRLTQMEREYRGFLDAKMRDTQRIRELEEDVRTIACLRAQVQQMEQQIKELQQDKEKVQDENETLTLTCQGLEEQIAQKH